MILNGIDISEDFIKSFSKKWKIKEFAMFGSILRNDFDKNSDIDVLLTFSQNAKISLLDFVIMQDELKSVFHREVDIIEKNALNNPYRKKEIMNNFRVVYEV